MTKRTTTENHGTRAELLRMLGENDSPPAFVIRAQRVEAVWTAFLGECEKERDELSTLTRTRLGQVSSLVDGQWHQLIPFLVASSHAEYLQQLHDRWRPELRLPPNSTTSGRKIRLALRELVASMQRFNRRWDDYLRRADLRGVNWERQEYNNFYLVEKAAAFGSEYVAALGFERLEDLTHEDVEAALPRLMIPQLV